MREPSDDVGTLDLAPSIAVCTGAPTAHAPLATLSRVPQSRALGRIQNGDRCNDDHLRSRTSRRHCRHGRQHIPGRCRGQRRNDRRSWQQSGSRHARDRCNGEARAAGWHRCARAHRAALRHGRDECRHVRERHGGGGARRHDDGHSFRRAASGQEPGQGRRGLSCAGKARRRHRLRDAYDHRRSDREGAHRGAARADQIGAWLDQSFHDLRENQGRRRAASRCSARGTHAQGARVCARGEQWHDQLDGAAAGRKRVHRAQVSHRLPSATWPRPKPFIA